jgi:hypothetical protein
VALEEASVEVAEVAAGEAWGSAAASVGFDVTAFTGFHFELLGPPSLCDGDFGGMLLVWFRLGRDALSKILI